MSYRLGTYRFPPPSAFPADFPLGGTTPSPIPSSNTEDVRNFNVGSMVLGPGYATTPTLDANLTVRNVTTWQAGHDVLDIVHNALVGTGATVDDAQWVTGGFVHVTWRPGASEPAVAYATRVRDALLQAALQLSPRAQIFFTRLRVNMPPLRTDLYVYPTGSVPAPPPPPAGTPTPPDVVSSSTTAPAEGAAGGTNYVVLFGALGVLGVLGGVGYVLSRRRQAVQRNRSRRRRVRR